MASQFFAEFFVNEARKSDHHFKNSKTEDDYVIYNFPVKFTGRSGSAFEQCYLFPADANYMTNIQGKYFLFFLKNYSHFNFSS